MHNKSRKNNSVIGFEVPTAVTMKNSTFWDIAQHSPVSVNPCLREACHLHLWSWKASQGTNQQKQATNTWYIHSEKPFIPMLITLFDSTGWGTMLQARRSQVQFPMRSLDFSDLCNYYSRTKDLQFTQPVTERSTSNLLLGGGGNYQYLRLTTTPASVSQLPRKCGSLDILFHLFNIP
jgi:hypothetical protein